MGCAIGDRQMHDFGAEQAASIALRILERNPNSAEHQKRIAGLPKTKYFAALSFATEAEVRASILEFTK